MTKLMKALYVFILRLWPENPAAEPPEALPPTKPRRQSKPGKEDATAAGEFYFRESILDVLDDYFRIINRMRSRDPEAFALYQKVGAHILPAFSAENKSVSAWWRQNRPSFGAVAFAIGPEVEAIEKKEGSMHPRLLYFRKYQPTKAPPEIQRAQGDIYVMTVYWDVKGKFSAPIDYGISISPNGGDIRALRALRTTMKTIRSKNGDFSIPQRQWGFGSFLRSWAAEHHMDAEDFIRHIFLTAVNSYEMAHYSLTRIDVRRGATSAIFGVNIKRTPYFFKDRQKTGKRIFHSVASHSRIRDGKQQNVRLHFRGEREFVWNGYSVKITVPGRHHFNLSDFDVGMIDVDEKDRTAGMDMLQFGNTVRGWIDAGVGAKG